MPSYLQHWEDALAKWCKKLKLRVVMSSGDFLPIQLSNKLVALLPDNCALINLYGVFPLLS